MSAHRVDESLARSAEEQLRQIPGVESVAIDHVGGDIEAIHVLADQSRRAKQIVRDVISSLRTLYDLTIDHKKISVVCRPTAVTPARRPNGRTRPTAESNRAGRVEIRSVMLRDMGDACEAQVVLSIGGREVMGSALGGASVANEGRLLAEATAEALERLLDERYRLTVGEVELLPSFSRRGVILVTLLLGDGRSERELLGSALGDEGLRRAAVYATLDATNRVFGRLARRRHVDYDVGPTSLPGEVSEEMT